MNCTDCVRRILILRGRLPRSRKCWSSASHERPGATCAPAAAEIERRRLVWRCRRGMKELDGCCSHAGRAYLPRARLSAAQRARFCNASGVARPDACRLPHWPRATAQPGARSPGAPHHPRQLWTRRLELRLGNAQASARSQVLRPTARFYVFSLYFANFLKSSRSTGVKRLWPSVPWQRAR